MGGRTGMGIADAICTGIGRDIKSDLVYGREGQVSSRLASIAPPTPIPVRCRAQDCRVGRMPQGFAAPPLRARADARGRR